MKNFPIILFLLILASCSGGRQNCEYGEPVAIFNADLQGVNKHTFQKTGQEGYEELFFSNGLHVAVIQSGCNAIRQEFRFTLPGAPPNQDDEGWKATAIRLFTFLGNLSPAHAEYHQYAQTIDQLKADLKFGEEIELGQGFALQMDRIASSQSALLQVVIRQGTED